MQLYDACCNQELWCSFPVWPLDPNQITRQLTRRCLIDCVGKRLGINVRITMKWDLAIHSMASGEKLVLQIVNLNTFGKQHEKRPFGGNFGRVKTFWLIVFAPEQIWDSWAVVRFYLALLSINQEIASGVEHSSWQSSSSYITTLGLTMKLQLLNSRDWAVDRMMMMIVLGNFYPISYKSGLKSSERVIYLQAKRPIEMSHTAGPNSHSKVERDLTGRRSVSALKPEMRDRGSTKGVETLVVTCCCQGSLVWL